MDIKGTGDLSAIGGVNISLFNLSGIKFDVTKLIDPTAKGFNKVFNIVLGRVHADKIRHIALSAAQTNLDIRRIEQGLASYDHEDQSLVEHPENIKSLIAAAIQDEEIANILRCSIFAANFIDEDNNSSEPSINFINRWRDEARLISGDDLINIWGGILASEINRPQSISLRTLDIIRNITPAEADIFLKASDYVLWDGYIFNNKEIDIDSLDNAGLANQYRLQDIGYPTSGLTPWPQKNFSVDGKCQNFFYLENKQDIFLLSSLDIEELPSCKLWELTPAGKELFSTIKSKDEEYKASLFEFGCEAVKASIKDLEKKDQVNPIDIFHSKKESELNFRKLR